LDLRTIYLKIRREKLASLELAMGEELRHSCS
jgi:hypothetical protein